ncbi:carboxypeptidase-like regulatory domain-containing protein [Sphingobacterium sp. E70]|uniref:carboxypeptidase-like regulatory domain-containing protein n=1 Tax=Sphingobacterium sp. E70 TaxID=2853439 RepID=UPI00211C1F91|nr:carboxypeptidase-like regulatory domain-containing protein [Sphingobacterium sp. E70]ULT26208.1 carboxypeptidase-like regulatory domain-containing protein [Sphingobacterium sp. E70]
MITPITKTVGKGLLLFSLMSMAAPNVFAQSQLKISGKVTSPAGEPLAGVTVLIKGAKNGTVTDVSGNYQIVAKDIDVLIFSLVGREKAEIAVDKKIISILSYKNQVVLWMKLS